MKAIAKPILVAAKAGATFAGVEVRQLRALAAIVDCGSMTAAARQLGVSQSTISEAVAALERTLGTALLVRRGGERRLLLTAAGDAALPHVRSALAAVEKVHAAAIAVSREARGRVEVIANESISTYLLPPVLAVLQERWPGTRFSVSGATCALVEEGVASGQFDIGLTCGLAAKGQPAKRPDGVEVVGTHLRLAVFCNPGHPLTAASAAAVELPALMPYRIFTSDASGNFREAIGRFFAAFGPGPQLVSVGSIEAVKRNVAANPLDVGVLPAYAIAEELRRGAFQTLDLEPEPPAVWLQARFSRSRTVSAAATELVDVLRSTLAGSGKTPRAAQRSR